MVGPHLIYFADPMCAWCYGFTRVVAAVREVFADGLPIRLVMGGLRPGHEERLSEAALAEIEAEWRQVSTRTGLPVDPTALRRPGFVYDTDPAARAVIAVRQQDPELALTYLARVQQAFHAEGRNVTRGPVLALLAAEYGLDADAFLESWAGTPEQSPRPRAQAS